MCLGCGYKMNPAAAGATRSSSRLQVVAWKEMDAWQMQAQPAFSTRYQGAVAQCRTGVPSSSSIFSLAESSGRCGPDAQKEMDDNRPGVGPGTDQQLQSSHFDKGGHCEPHFLKEETEARTWMEPMTDCVTANLVAFHPTRLLSQHLAQYLGHRRRLHSFIHPLINKCLLRAYYVPEDRAVNKFKILAFKDCSDK